MVTVPTSDGAVSVDDLGVVLMHEHVFIRTEALHAGWPGFGRWDEEAELASAAERLGQLRKAGIGALLDRTVPGLGRDPALVTRAAAGTGLRVLFSTGLYTRGRLPAAFRGDACAADGETALLESLFERDLTDGIGDSGIRAAVLTLSTDASPMTDDDRRLARAVARVSARTGAVICTRAHARSQRGLDQQRVLAGYGADLSRVLVGACSETTDLSYLEALIAAGSFIGWDGCGQSMDVPLATQLDTLAELCWRGYAGRVMLSHGRPSFTDAGPGTGASARVLPAWQHASGYSTILKGLRDRGVPERDIEQMLVRNPRDFLSRGSSAAVAAAGSPSAGKISAGLSAGRLSAAEISAGGTPGASARDGSPHDGNPGNGSARAGASRDTVTHQLAGRRDRAGTTMVDHGHATRPGGLTGRTREISELRAAARDARLLTLCGAGGIGKTRLLRALLPALAPDYPDGTFLVTLTDVRQPFLVPALAAVALAVAEEPGVPLANTMAEALRDRRLVLALDACEQLPAACADLAVRLTASCPGVLIVAASRTPLGMSAETVWPVPPLALPAGEADGQRPAVADAAALDAAALDAAVPGAGAAGRGAAGRGVAEPGAGAGPGVAGRGAGAAAGTDAAVPDAPVTDATVTDAMRLFAERAAAAAPGFALDSGNRAAVATACRALDGLPLAIELAAAWIGELDADQLAAQLTDHLGLAPPGGRADRARYRATMRSAVAWSHEMLTPAEQVLLRRLSVFSGWSLEMAERVCAGDDLPAARVNGLLVGLAQRSLIAPRPGAAGPGRYRMPGAVRDYAAVRLHDAGESDLLRRRLRDYVSQHVEYFASIGKARVSATWQAIRELFRGYNADARNFRSVLGWCLTHGDTEMGLRICTELGISWMAVGATTEGGGWIDAFLGVAGPDVPAAIRGPALAVRGQLAFFHGDLRCAESWAKTGLAMCEAAGDEHYTIIALNTLAQSVQAQGRADDALRYADQALDQAQAAGDAWNHVYALNNRAAALLALGRPAEARQSGEAGLAMTLETGQHWGAALARLLLGDVTFALGDLVAARDYYLAVLPFARQAMPAPDTARCLARLGRIAVMEGQPGPAREYLAESLQLGVSSGSRVAVARALLSFADLAVAAGKPDLAVQLAAAATAAGNEGHLPPPPERTQHFRDAAAARLGTAAADRLWAVGLRLGRDAAARLALQVLAPSGASAGPEPPPAAQGPPSSGPESPS